MAELIGLLPEAGSDPVNESLHRYSQQALG